MDLIVRLKTGFFEKTAYRLESLNGRLTLSPVSADGAERIVLDEKDVLSVTLTEGRVPELEIQTKDVLYQAVFAEGISFVEALDYLKKHMHVNITCQYKGGEKHA